MAIDVVAVGQSGAHSFRKTNVNTEDNYLYFNDAAGETVPSTLSQGTGFIFNNRAGSIGGITDGGLVFVGAQNIDASGGDIVEELEINGVVKKVHTFYTPGTSTFSVNSLNGNTDGVEVYVIGGGGGGTNVSGSSGGGGGGGGVAFGTVNLSAGDYTVTVGDGGAGNTNGNGGNGGTSTFQGLSATGGQGAQGSTGGTGGVGSGGTVNGTGGTGGNGGPSPAPAGSAGTNGGAGGGGGGSDNSKGGDGGDGDAAYSPVVAEPEVEMLEEEPPPLTLVVQDTLMEVVELPTAVLPLRDFPVVALRVVLLVRLALRVQTTVGAVAPTAVAVVEPETGTTLEAPKLVEPKVVAELSLSLTRFLQRALLA